MNNTNKNEADLSIETNESNLPVNEDESKYQFLVHDMLLEHFFP